MKNKGQQSNTIIVHNWSISILFFTLLLSVTSCEKWDLETTDFVEVFTSEKINLGENNTEVIVFGEIKGLASENSVDQHGHIWSSTVDAPTLGNKEGQITFLKQSNGTFSSMLEGLLPATVYFYRAYAVYEGQPIYGTVRTITTNSLSFNAAVDSIFNLTRLPNEFQAEATISIKGIEQGVFIADYGIAWGLQSEPNVEENYFISKSSTTSDGLPITYNTVLTKLQPGLNYMRPYLIIGGLIFYGNEKSFKVGDFWTQKVDFSGDYSWFNVGFSINDKGYIGIGSGGVSDKGFWEYDPQADSWTQKADFGGENRRNASGFSINGKGYIGTGNNIFGPGLLKDFWEYDPQADSWTQKEDFGGTARDDAVGFSINDKGYIGTGSGNKDFWEYNPQTDSWTQKADLGAVGRSSAVGFSINDKGYIGTGSGNKDFWEYNPQADSWTQKADLGAVGRSNAVGFSINDKGYIGTGSGNKDFWEYDPQADSWIQKADFGAGSRSNAVGFSINDKGYIGTGNNLTFIIKDFWEYLP